ncbi:MAG: hypothetical protein CVU56_14795 [Deltaproteobacteria bacterium HGW-Deltaproteobacteria-14]|jgi:endonuclease/exonuclease/phosphatase family metal-dependent hydrolase|nr:MAG: hypothetical protein CVU56_14795 [Deltaproteobacteria bacterium HGW-Deltaproteobacteria-14]
MALSILALACAPALLAGCDSAASPEPRVAVVATYNLGLAAGYVDYAAQRRPQQVTLLEGLDADLVCLQEVWTQADIDAIVAGVAATFPYHHEAFIEDHTIGDPSCEAGPLATLRACVEDKCADVAAGELASCVTGNCADPFFATAPACQVCLAANLGKPFDDIFTACTNGSELFTYSGANGLLMLSKVPLSNTSHMKLDSSLTQRSVLGATATLPRLGEVDFFCTHVAADLSGEISYNGAFGSYEGENIHQMDQILAFMGAHATAAAKPILAGDFNSGPAIAPHIDAELPDGAYATLVAAGWASLTVAAASPMCTFCADNHLVADTHDDVLIDHVWVKGLSRAFKTSVTRIGTAPITVDDGGADVETNPSDHYGAAVQFDYVP